MNPQTPDSRFRVLLVTQDDPFYLPLFFEAFISEAKDHPGIEILGVVIQAPLGKSRFSQLVRKMYDFYGLADFLRMGVKFAWKKVWAKVAVGLFRGRFPGVHSVRHLLLKKEWPVYDLGPINGPGFLSQVGDWNPDLILSVAASQKFGEKVLQLPRLGCLNIHNAKLPRNRGMLPNFWSLLNCRSEPLSAMTVHRMNRDLDDGDILIQDEFALDPAESLDSLIRRTKVENASLAWRALELMRQGEPEWLPNKPEEATYNTFPTREDVRRFRSEGFRLL